MGYICRATSVAWYLWAPLVGAVMWQNPEVLSSIIQGKDQTHWSHGTKAWRNNTLVTLWRYGWLEGKDRLYFSVSLSCCFCTRRWE